MDIISLVIGLIIGVIIGFAGGKLTQTKSKHDEEDLLEFRKILLKTQESLDSQRAENKTLIGEVARTKEQLLAAKEKLSSQKEDLEKMKESLKLEFANLAQKIFEEKSNMFKKDNKEGIDAVLSPLKERIKEFSDKVEKAHHEEIKGRADMKAELERLLQLNNQLSSDAKNLTTALKGESKTQGNWGELILEKVLENSGLEKGREYEVQYSTVSEEGNRIQPDIVIKLPENKHIIIDSKVSLVAYERFANAEDAEERARHLKDHIASVKNHVRQLSEKNYQKAKDIVSPDFVLLFVPIESSFAVAVQADTELFNYSWSKKIVIVTPSTLLATLRTISSVWKREKQNRNVQEIAKLAGRLYDKLVAYTHDLEKVGEKLHQASKAHDEATKKLHQGSDNIIRIAERTRKLGANTKKDLPKALIDQSLAEDFHTENSNHE